MEWIFYLIGVIVAVVILFVFFVFVSFWRYKSKIQGLAKAVQRETNKLPHELFPELLHWEIGDKVVEESCDAETFLGILDGKIHTKTKTQMYSYTPLEAQKRLKNNSAKARHLQFEEKRIARGIETDQYNIFLKLLKEENEKLLGSDTENLLTN